ncbi:hypothetical protein COOONC_06034 [Cooperia oncophora]
MTLIYLSTLLYLCESYKILVINPKCGYSHMNFMGKIADVLVDAGHEVVTFQPVIETIFAGNGTTKSRLIQVGPFDESNKKSIFLDETNMKPLWTVSASNPIGVLLNAHLLAGIAEKTLSNVLDNKEILQQLKDENFDVAITELFDFIGIGQ